MSNENYTGYGLKTNLLELPSYVPKPDQLLSGDYSPMPTGSDIFGGMIKPTGYGIRSSLPVGIPGAGDSSPSAMDWFFGNSQQQGKGGLVLGAAGGIGNLFMGMQQYNLAKQALATTKEQIDRNYTAQKQMTNADLEDRQRARIASNPGAYVPLSDYMNQNGIK